VVFLQFHNDGTFTPCKWQRLERYGFNQGILIIKKNQKKELERIMKIILDLFKEDKNNEKC